MTQARSVVVGLGEIGAPLFNLIQKAEPSAQGLDITPKTIQGPVGLLHICYPFTDPQLFQQTTCQYAARFNPSVVVVHATVLPGTCAAIQQATGVPVVFSPVRGKHVRMEQDLQHYRKFVASSDEKALDAVIQSFEAAGLPTQKMEGPCDALELAKLLETTYFGLLIAWAQEMERFASAVGGDYYAIASFFKEIPYLPPKTFVPGFIGGHCVMPNIALLEKIFTSDFLETIKKSNSQKEADASQNEQGKNRHRVEPV